MQKIALIMPYFGEWPKWIDLFLYSCSKNTFIDFLFFTDNPIPRKTYCNTIFHHITFADYCQRISITLGIDFSPLNAYKLCDMKPFYGVVHEEELKDYDWWGWGDIDLVYGDLSRFLSEKNLNRYDLLTTHVTRLSGHLTLIRKESRFTKMCFDIQDWKRLLENKENVEIDEGYFTRMVRPIYTEWYMKSYQRIIVHFLKGYHHLFDYYWGQLIKIFPSRILWYEAFTTFLPSPKVVNTYDLDSGKVFCPSRQSTPIKEGEKIYLHFLFFKKTQYWNTTQYWKEDFYQIPEDYDFSKGGLIEITTEGIRLHHEYERKG